MRLLILTGWFVQQKKIYKLKFFWQLQINFVCYSVYSFYDASHRRESHFVTMRATVRVETLKKVADKICYRVYYILYLWGIIKRIKTSCSHKVVAAWSWEFLTSWYVMRMSLFFFFNTHTHREIIKKSRWKFRFPAVLYIYQTNLHLKYTVSLNNFVNLFTSF